MAPSAPQSALSTSIKQSPPLDLTVPYSASWVKNKTILITGGASGFGAGFVRKWAANGATVIVGDINVEGGDGLVRSVRSETNNPNVHFVHCDVTDWQSQVNLFKEAVKLSPHGGIDTVVANAGIAAKDPLQFPETDLSAPEPPKPNFKILDVNLTGVVYTTHLAFFWLPRNPGSKSCGYDPSTDPEKQVRDRHLLLIGSIAALAPIAIQPQYCASKHAVLGLFRSLRATTFLQGIRVNLVCPYFIDTPIVPPAARLALAGGGMGKVEDVVDAGTRFVADSRIVGRALVIGPKVGVIQLGNGEWKVVEKETAGATETAIFEAYADDWEESEAFNKNIVKMLHAVQTSRGWIGWAKDVANVLSSLLGFGKK